MSEVKICALVVDDSALIRTMVKSALRAVGVSDLTEARDGKEALSLLDSQKFELMVLDWNMPEVTGLEVVEAMRNGESLNKDIPILMVTAEATKDKVSRIAKLKVNGYVVKPITSEILEKKLSILVKRLDLQG